MYFKTDLLETVQQELLRRKGSLRSVAENTGLHYDTVLRIMRGTFDPGYSKVRRIAVVLGLAPPPAAKAPAKKRVHR